MKRFLSAFLALTMGVTLLPMPANAATEAEQEPLNYRLWYDEPAANSYSGWENYSLPIGNSAIGGNVFGRYDTERVTLNEKTFWTGGPSESRPNYMGGNLPDKGRNGEALKEIQDLFLAGDTSKGSQLCGQNLVGTSEGYGGYQLFGNLYMEFGHTDVTDYRRDLDVMTGIATVGYTVGETRYEREYFTSYPDNVMVIHLTAEGTDTLNFAVSMTPENNGSATSTFTTTGTDEELCLAGALNDNQLKYNGLLQVELAGESAASKKDGDKLTISGAEEVTIVLSMATDYKNDYPKYRTGETDEELAARVRGVVENAAAKSYDELRSTHLSDFTELTERVNLDLGQVLPDMPTDDLLSAYKSGKLSQAEKAYLEVLLYQYGRYLLVSSSRGDTLPANLQGIWVGKNDNPWSSDYHINVNLQMNYWPAYSGNLAECALPLIDYVDSMREPGRVTAEIYFGVVSDEENPENGFTAHTQNTPYGWTCPGWSFDWGWSPAAVPWILQNVWEYYEYTGDEEFMADRIYPMLKEETKFYIQTMRQDENGKWISTPSYSPEHGPRTNGNTYEQSLIWQLLTDTITAGKIVGEDPEVLAQWQDVLDNLRDPIEIGEDGQIKEWYEETTLGSVPGSDAYGHRHLSHLLGLFPGDLISEETPEWLEAARVSLEARVDQSTGWAMGQRINTWARLGDGERTYDLIGYLFNGGILNNLWDTHAPFQIDGNFGYTSGVNEMLLQSNMGYINILPAIPEEWSSGSVDGIVARGNFEVGIRWRDMMPYEITILSNNGGPATVQFDKGTSFVIRNSAGEEIPYTAVEGKENRYTFETEQGETYIIENELPMGAPTGVAAERRTASEVNVSWDALDGAVSYNVYRSLNGGEYELVARNVHSISFTDRTAVQLKLSDTYSYQVAGMDAAGNEGMQSSETVEAGLRNYTVDGADASVKLIGSWYSNSEADHYMSTNNYSWTPGSAAELTFTGTGIELYSVAKPNYNGVYIYIDGEKMGDWYSVNADPKQPNFLVYSNMNLPDGEHTIRVEVMDKVVVDSPSVKDESISIDYFKVYQDERVSADTVSVTSPTGVTMLEQVGQTIQLAAEVLPEEAPNRAVEWRITAADGSETELATVSKSGLVTATGIGNGTVLVTAEAADGSGASDTITIQVTTDPEALTSDNYFLGTSFELIQGTLNSSAYGTKWLTDGYRGSDRGQDRFALKDATTPTILEVDLGQERTINQLDLYERVDLAWDVSHPGEGNPRIGSVEIQTKDAEGQWQTVATGCETYEEIDNNTLKRTMSFEEITAQELRVLLNHNLSCDWGITIWELEAYHVMDPSARGDKTELYKSLENAALVLESDFADDGWTTFVAARDAAIAVINDLAAGQQSIDAAKAALDATMEGITVSATLTGLRVDVPSTVLPVGGEMQLAVTAEYDRGADVICTEDAEFTAANGVISVDETGLVTAVAAGTDTLTIAYGGQTKTVEIQVLANPDGVLNVICQTGGTVIYSEEGPYYDGQEVTLTAQPAEGYRFTQWLVGEEIVTDSQLKVIVGETADVTACFEKDGSVPETYTITVTQSEGGTIAPATATVEQGKDMTFTITADEGYIISDVLVDGASVGAVETYTFEKVSADHTIAAVFAPEEIPVCTADAAIRVERQRDVDGNAVFHVTLSNAKNIAAVEVRFNAENVVSITGKNGFTYVPAGSEKGIMVLCYDLENATEGKTFTSEEETVIATITVSGEKPTVKLNEVLIAAYDGPDGKPAFGAPVELIQDTATFVGYDINSDGNVDLLDVVAAMKYYQAKKTDGEIWEAAQIADVNGDDKVDLQDLISIVVNIKR